MKLLAASLAAVTSVVLVVGCGGGASSGEAPDRHSESAAASGATATGSVASGAKSNPANPDKEAGGGKGDGSVPLDARDARVRRAIAGLIHPDRSDQEGEGAGGDNKQGKSDNGGDGPLGILDQIRRDARERLKALPQEKQDKSGQDGVLHILEMLR